MAAGITTSKIAMSASRFPLAIMDLPLGWRKILGLVAGMPNSTFDQEMLFSLFYGELHRP
jgi:hypothetical protein